MRREEIARAALKIIGIEGFKSLSTNRLAREVGLTPGALFRHFESLDAILLEAVRHAIRRVESTFPSRSEPAGHRLFRLAADRVDLLRSDPGLAWLLRSDQAHLSLPTQAVEELREVIGRSKRYLQEAIRDGISERSLRGDLDPDALLLIVMGTIHALVRLPGAHGAAGAKVRTGPTDVLATLKMMFAPATPHVATQSRRPRGKPAIRRPNPR
ncbi:MAG: TetR/AcrR family transcriptional regulator [Gemmatimonadota bacterium]